MSLHAESNLVYFVTTAGDPYDEGARQIQDFSKLPIHLNLNLGKPNVRIINRRKYIALPIVQRPGDHINKDILDKNFENLQNIVYKEAISSFSISWPSKTDKLNISTLREQLEAKFLHAPVQVTICKN